ncbi:MAG: ABC transporter substrate-binding protein [Anaerolineales bacterium]
MDLDMIRGRRTLFALVILLAGCARPIDLDIPFTPPATAGPGPSEPVATLEPLPTTLIVCLGQEPESLYRYSAEYLYGDSGRAAETVLQAIYDGPFDVRSYEYEPVILEKIPSLAEGDARIETVTVDPGDPYFNPERLQPANLTRGDRYLPAGCNSPECLQAYTGGQVSMDRMVVDFRLRPGVEWSDGHPLTAQDSVFSFELDRQVDTPTPKTQVDRTEAYEALDPETVRWTGIAGYTDSEYFSNFWSPLPQHVLGDRGAVDLLRAEETTVAPIGWGPYVIEQWRAGEDIQLRKNPSYFRAAEGLPAFDYLLFRFLEQGAGGSIEQLLTSECDVLDESAVADALDVELLDEAALSVLVDLESGGRIQLSTAFGPELERLEFGLAPVPGAGLPPIFSDPRTRAGVAACLDREGFVGGVLHGISAVPATYLSPEHPLYSSETGPVEFNRQEGIRLLEQAGWIDADGDPATARVAQGVAGVAPATELSFAFLTSPDGFHRSAADHFRADLAACGAELVIELQPAAELFRPWPDGPGFGRTFQTLGWAWPGWVSPLCEMFAGWEIPTPENPFGANASGFTDPAYDAACDVLLHGRPGSAEYLAAVEETQAIFAAQLPAIPLYMRPRVIAHWPEICGVDTDSTAFSALWNIEEIRPCGIDQIP